MKIDFNGCNVREVRSGTSKKGNSYTVVRFLSSEPEMYECVFTGPDAEYAAHLVKGSTYDFHFDLVPAFRGGVSLVFDGAPEVVY